MTDYWFKCKGCEKSVQTHTTADMPRVGETIECSFCKAEHNVIDLDTRLLVEYIRV